MTVLSTSISFVLLCQRIVSLCLALSVNLFMLYFVSPAYSGNSSQAQHFKRFFDSNVFTNAQASAPCIRVEKTEHLIMRILSVNFVSYIVVFFLNVRT